MTGKYLDVADVADVVCWTGSGRRGGQLVCNECDSKCGRAKEGTDGSDGSTGIGYVRCLSFLGGPVALPNKC